MPVAALVATAIVEPAIALVIGLVLLGQIPKYAAAIGVFLVVAAGIGAERSGARGASDDDGQPAVGFQRAGVGRRPR